MVKANYFVNYIVLKDVIFNFKSFCPFISYLQSYDMKFSEYEVLIARCFICAVFISTVKNFETFPILPCINFYLGKSRMKLHFISYFEIAKNCAE